MEAAGKQTFIVEVMPLTGGHLALPKVRLSKYILPKNSSTAPTNINPTLEANQNGMYFLIGVREFGTGGAMADPIFLEIGEILEFSTPNTSRSKEGAALKVISTPNILHLLPPLGVM